MKDRVRLTVLGGFLGAGKSTWLQHHLGSGVFDGACVIVNEAAATPVDHLLLAGAGRLLVLAGGCVCCDRRADLIALLRDLCDETPGDGRRPIEHIVLETSGLADPRAILAAVDEDPDLAESILPGEVVVLVDAPHGLGTLIREPLARRQVAGADCLVVTKLDEADDETTAGLVASLGLLNASAPCFGAIQGVETALPAEEAAPATALFDAMPGDTGPPLRAAQVEVAGVDWATCSLWLSALLHARGPDVLRAKGVMATPAGRLLLQVVHGRVHEASILPGPAARHDGTLIMIGRGFTSDDLQRSLQSWTGLWEA